MKIEAVSTITYQNFLEFYLFGLFRRKHYKAALAGMFTTFLAGLVLSIVLGYLNNFNSKSIILMILFLISVILVICIRFVIPKVNYNASKHLYTAPTHFLFDEDGFQVVQKSFNVDSNTNYTYDVIKNVYETISAYYIYISNNQAFIIPRDAVLNVIPADFSNFLFGKVEPPKYKRCY